MTALVICAHGKESGPWGSKIHHLADIALRLGCQVSSPDYSDLASPEDRVARLLSLPRPKHAHLILVGSSMGGYVSTLASRTIKPKGLFLMAPAFYMAGYAEQQPISDAEQTCVVFGRQDDVIPVEHGIRFADTNRAELHIIEGDHRLNGQLVQVGELFEAFLRRLGFRESRGFQTPEQLAAVARPFIGRTFHRWYADFDKAWQRDAKWSPRLHEVESCQPETYYGNIQVQFWGGGDLTLTEDSGRAFMGGWPISSLRLADRSIPQLYAESDIGRADLRSANQQCRYYPLQWKELIYGDILREVWVLAGENSGEYGPDPCICSIALKFVHESSGAERTAQRESPWLLGVSFDPRDEDSWRQTWLCKALPASVSDLMWTQIL